MIFGSEEIDENVVAVAIYKLRNVNGYTKVERLDITGPDEIIGFNPMANAGIPLKINGIQTFLPYDHARDMCSLQFGDQIAENFVSKTLNSK